MSAAIFFDFTPYRLKAANCHRFGPVRWWETPAARAKDTGAPWWEQKPTAKETTKPASNASFWDWLTK